MIEAREMTPKQAAELLERLLKINDTVAGALRDGLVRTDGVRVDGWTVDHIDRIVGTIEFQAARMRAMIDAALAEKGD